MPYILTYLASRAANETSSIPPSPVEVEYTSVQFTGAAVSVDT
ncbi:hypothetical protein AAXB25_25685 [Paenibacillus lautus]